MDLRDKVVWITGGARRLGRAMALDLAARGAHIVVHYHRSEAEARVTAADIEALGRRALTLRADLARVDEIDAMAAEIERAFGRLDVLINSAANFHRVPLAEVTEADWDRALDVNLKGAYFCARAAARLMARSGGGKIVNFADWAGFRPYRNFSPYMISKGGVITMTQALAVELAPKIAVNAVAPGVVLPPDAMTEAEAARALRNIPLGRFGAPEDIVKTVAFLLEGSDYITGQVICVDGGRLLANAARDAET
jgi:pteridine reductase